MNAIEQDILAALNDPIATLTARKATELITDRHGRVTGVVLRFEDGRMAIIEKSAVRWLTAEQAWDLMHPKQGYLIPQKEVRFNNKYSFGFVFGFGIGPNRGFDVNLETRLIEETAVGLNADFRF